jgi:hypothetical protein
MGLERETLRRMAECFGGRACCRCGRPAERLARHHFYCSSHFPRPRTGAGEPPPTVYKCHVSPRGAPVN